MRILFIGDVVGESGCALVRKVLPGFKRLQGVDFCVVNGENSATLRNRIIKGETGMDFVIDLNLISVYR